MFNYHTKVERAKDARICVQWGFQLMLVSNRVDIQHHYLPTKLQQQQRNENSTAKSAENSANVSSVLGQSHAASNYGH